MCRCDPLNGSEATEWVRVAFSDCLYTPLDNFSFIIGLLSIALWLCAQAPQLVKNFRNKTAESLSIWFLLQWFSGDVCNLIGCVLTQQLPTQLYTAIYFVCVDTFTVGQYTYYGRIYKGPRPHRVTGVVAVLGLASVGMLASSVGVVGGGGGGGVGEGGGRVLLQAVIEPACNSQTGEEWQQIVGTVIAWASGCIYVSSRIPQIYKNYKRGSTDGLSPLMFMAAIMGNVTYGISILTRLPLNWDYMEGKLPFILGSLGTCCFDTTILIQFFRYSRKGNYELLLKQEDREESIKSVVSV